MQTDLLNSRTDGATSFENTMQRAYGASRPYSNVQYLSGPDGANSFGSVPPSTGSQSGCGCCSDKLTQIRQSQYRQQSAAMPLKQINYNTSPANYNTPPANYAAPQPMPAALPQNTAAANNQAYPLNNNLLPPNK